MGSYKDQIVEIIYSINTNLQAEDKNFCLEIFFDTTKYR